MSAIESDVAASVGVPAGYNPIDGVNPDPSVFGIEFESTLQMVLAGVWGVALVLCVIWMAIGGAKWGMAKKQGRADDLTEGAEAFKSSSVAFGVTAALGLVVGAILALV